AGKPDKKRRGHGPSEQLQLLVVDQDHPLPDDQRTCPQCHGTVEPMGDQAEVSEEITIMQSQVVLVRHRRLKYRCRCNACVLTAPAPEKLQAGGRYSISFSVHVAADKYLDHLPLSRQAGRFARMGLKVSPQTLWDQVRALLPHLRPTYQAMCAEILSAPVVNADETHWHFLAGDQSGERKRWYAWGISTPSLAAYHILDSRSNEAAKLVLAGYAGTVVADGYRVYGSLSQDGRQEKCLETGQPPPRFRLANCWAHVRRKFVEALNHYPEGQTAIDLIGLLFHVEHRAGPIGDESTLDLRAHLRESLSRPLVDALFAWSKAQKALPRSLFGRALAYMQSLKAGLTVFLDDPRVPIHNNAAERSLRGMVVGRKTHYGSKSRLGIEAAAVCYTLFESAKLSGIDPVAYVEAVARQAIRQPGAVLLPAEFKARCQSS
ncbi:MAG: IS66 family transposase, partial [Candidatus Sericytochromatia bacterium]|nr:IS66 family transposase [Candidatus Sericytochromatia bacterium]